MHGSKFSMNYFVKQASVLGRCKYLTRVSQPSDLTYRDVDQFEQEFSNLIFVSCGTYVDQKTLLNPVSDTLYSVIFYEPENLAESVC